VFFFPASYGLSVNRGVREPAEEQKEVSFLYLCERGVRPATLPQRSSASVAIGV
jgi:hypothetical protein